MVFGLHKVGVRIINRALKEPTPRLKGLAAVAAVTKALKRKWLSCLPVEEVYGVQSPTGSPVYRDVL